MHVPSQKGAPSYIYNVCARSIDFASFCDFSIGFWNGDDNVVFSFILACFDGRENNHLLFFTAFSDFELQILEISGKCERYLWSRQ